MKIRLYLDEDAMDGDLVQALRLRGVDVTTANLEGMANCADDEHLEYATHKGESCTPLTLAITCAFITNT